MFIIKPISEMEKKNIEYSFEKMEEYKTSIIITSSCIFEYMVDNSHNNIDSVFIGKNFPDLSICDYYYRIFKYFSCSTVVFLTALIYMDRLSSKVEINKYTVHRLIITTLVIAVKYVEDLHYSNAYYAQVGGITLQELNKYESKILEIFEYELEISQSDIETYMEQIIIHPEECPECKEYI
jgi:hypothetical protein